MEFPFVDPVSRSVAIAGMITPVLRGAFGKAPLFFFVAPESGTGKSYLVTLISTIATGRPPAAVGASDDNEEMEKLLLWEAGRLHIARTRQSARYARRALCA